MQNYLTRGHRSGH